MINFLPSNITAQQEKIDEDVNSLKIAIEKTLDDSNDLRRKLVQNDKDRDLRLAKLGEFAYFSVILSVFRTNREKQR